MTFPDYQHFKQSDLAQAMLKCVYDVMERGEKFYPGDVWRNFNAEHHIRKAMIHAANAHQDINKRDMANTGYYDWMHALTRLAMVACLIRPYCEAKEMVVDTTEQEMTHE